MKKRWLSMLLALCMTAAMLPSALATEDGGERPPASGGGGGLAAIQSLVCLEGDTGDVTLTEETTMTADVAVYSDTVLDLNGQTLNTNGYTIEVRAGAKLTVRGGNDGKIWNADTTNAELKKEQGDPHTLILVDAGAELLIENGHFYSKTYQLLSIFGKAVIQDGVFHCLADDTGLYDSRPMISVTGESASLAMEYGQIYADSSKTKDCGMYGIYAANGAQVTLGSDEEALWGSGPMIVSTFAALGANNYFATSNYTIYGGYYEASYGTAAFANSPQYEKFCAPVYLSANGSVNIYGGDFSGKYAVSVPYKNTAVQLSIADGMFLGETDNFYIGTGDAVYPGEGGNQTAVSGGVFLHDVDQALLTDGKTTVKTVLGVGGEEMEYRDAYQVMDKGGLEFATGAPAVEAAPGVDVDEEIKTALQSSEADLSMLGYGLSQGLQPPSVDEAKNALTGAGVTVPDGQTVSVVVEPYLNIQIKGYDATAKTLLLDMKPEYNVVATTDPNHMEKGESGKNAVDLETAQPISEADGWYAVELVLPSGFIDDDTPNVFVKHTKADGRVFYYPAAIHGGKASFVILNGFSEFELKTDARTGTITFDYGLPESYTAKDVGNVLPEALETGYRFTGWLIDGALYNELTDALLTKLDAAPGKTLSAQAQFVSASSGSSGGTASYAITANAGEGGSISPSGKVYVNANAGKTFTIKAAEGYRIADVQVDGASVGAVESYTFEKVQKAHTITASFAKLDEAGDVLFEDVSESDWFYDGVRYAAENGLMNGVGGARFDPDGATTRGMVVAILWRLEKEAEAGAAGFSDVPAGAYYAKAVDWAADSGIVSGYAQDRFGPDDAISREQLAAILYRYAQQKGYDVSAAAELTAFADGDSVSAYAKTAMAWANAAGLVQGVSENRLAPQNGATRAQVATVLMRFLKQYQ